MVLSHMYGQHEEEEQVRIEAQVMLHSAFDHEAVRATEEVVWCITKVTYVGLEYHSLALNGMPSTAVGKD